MSCHGCRHFRRDTVATLGQIAGDDLRHLPSIQTAGESARLGLCAARNEYVDTTYSCESWSSRVWGRLAHWLAVAVAGWPDSDVLLRARYRREAREEADRRQLARARAEREIKPGVCATCGRKHNRCLGCDMPIMACGMCERCRLTMTVLKTGTGADGVEHFYWRCSNCAASGEGLPDLPAFEDGRCDGCRAVWRAQQANGSSGPGAA